MAKAKARANRGPWALLQCPHCKRWPNFWICRCLEGKASEYKPKRFCPGCKKEVAA